MLLKIIGEKAKNIVLLGLLYAPAYIYYNIKDVHSLNYAIKCRDFQNKFYKNFKISEDLYEAYKFTAAFSSIKPVGIECLFIKSELVPVKSIELLNDASALGKNVFHYQTGPTYSQKIIKGLKKVLDAELSRKYDEKVKALSFEFKKD